MWYEVIEYILVIIDTALVQGVHEVREVREVDTDACFQNVGKISVLD